jgi:circadian clock protein KaiC
LGGGVPAHRLYVLEGTPGTGKTTFALQFLREGVRLGRRVLYVTLSETLEELTDLATSHNWTLDGVDVLELESLSDRFQHGSDYTVFHPSDVELEDTISHIRAEVERLNPERVALDSVSELRILSQTTARYRREILGLKQFFAGRKCTVLVLDECTPGENQQQLQGIAHGVLRMEREPREYGTTRRQIQVVKMRGVQFQDGRHDFIIKSGGLEVYPRFSGSDSTVTREGAAESGSPEMDTLLGGGLDRGASTLLIGPAGCGKTTLCSQYLIAALQRGEQVVCYQFEESRQTFLQRSSGFGMDFERYIAAGKFDLVPLDVAELSPGEFSARVRHAVEERKASFVLIDSLNGYLNGMPSERFLLIHVRELLTYLGQKGVVTLMTLAQHGMLGAGMQTPLDVSFLADTVILLRFFEAAGQVRQAISVVKKRRGAHERTLREMKIGTRGVQIGQVLQQFEGVLTGVPRFRGNQDQLLGASED